ncbi:hypothetical protein GW17_00017332 [Ensete ventricosum]|nr:hypothetical protein GW17_00017332 [Ensete ventricosum]
MGTAGMVFLTSSLNSGICSTALLVVNVVGGLVVFHDEFGAQKVASMVSCVWGFASYLYGEYKRKTKADEEEELIGAANPASNAAGNGGEIV